MAINKNHEFDELDGTKCAIVERNASAERTAFLKDLLEYNGFKVVVATPPPPKTPPSPKPVGEGETLSIAAEPSSTYTIGVTNLAFNPTNAVYARMLKTKDGHIVTPAYWQQKEAVSHDEIPYFERS